MDFMEDERMTVTLEQGQDLVQGLVRFAQAEGLARARFVAEGALAYAVLGSFDWRVEREQEIPVDGRIEAMSIVGWVHCDGTECAVDAHASLVDRSGQSLGGPLLEAYVHGRMPVVLTGLASRPGGTSLRSGDPGRDAGTHTRA